MNHRRHKRYRSRSRIAATLEERGAEIVEELPRNNPHEMDARAYRFWADVLETQPAEKRAEIARVLSEAFVLQRKAGEAACNAVELLCGGMQVLDPVFSALSLTADTILDTLDPWPEPDEPDTDSLSFEEIIETLRDAAAAPREVFVLTEEAEKAEE